MAEQGAYGGRLGFRLSHMPSLSTTSTRQGPIAVTQCRSEAAAHGRTRSIPSQDAYGVGLFIEDCADLDVLLDGRVVSTGPMKAGSILIHDLRRDPILDVRSPFHLLDFYLSRKALDAIADDAEAPRIGALRSQPGTGVEDAVVRDLGLLLIPALTRPDALSRLFVENVLLAIGAHVAKTYGGLKTDDELRRGGLAPWQERRAKEVLTANLHGDIAVDAIAKACGLSSSHFSRAFRQSTGLAPHQWLLNRRVETAKDLLLRSRDPLSEVGLACGFADQSHFTRVFTRMVGTSPGAWKRQSLGRRIDAQLLDA